MSYVLVWVMAAILGGIIAKINLEFLGRIYCLVSIFAICLDFNGLKNVDIGR